MLGNSDTKDCFIILDQQTVMVLSHYKVSRDFLFLVFSMNQFPQAPEYSIKTDLNFFLENSRRYSQVKVHTGINDTGGKFFHQFH